MSGCFRKRRLEEVIMPDRRSFLTGLGAAGVTGFVGVRRSFASEPPPETTTVRLPQWIGGAYCWAAEYVAGELMRADGLTEVRFLQSDSSVDQAVWMARGDTDFSINFPPNHISSIDTGVPIKVLAGLHSGCLELIANDKVRSIRDLRGKRVGVEGLGSSSHVLLSLMAAYVGLDPANDMEWVVEMGSPTELFIDGKVDAFLGSPPKPQRLRARNIGHTILNMTTDPPWSQHFCCMICGSADYVSRYPVATKRVLRAIFKAADLCVSDPAWIAQQLVDRGFVASYDDARQTLNDIRYDRWRDYDAEDSLRFYALRMQETGMIKSSPQAIIANGTDWRFLNELKRELKA
jgi:NitT/TauT family transport system substrate-binding protein